MAQNKCGDLIKMWVLNKDVLVLGDVVAHWSFGRAPDC